MCEIRKYLEQNAFFGGISSSGRDSLAEICSIVELRRKEVLFFESDEGRAVYILVDGAMQLHKTTSDGKEVVIKVLQPGEMFAEVILFELDSYPVTAAAIAPSRVLVIPKQHLSALLNRSEFRDDFISMLMQKQRYLSDRIRYLTSYDLEDRFRMFLKEHFGCKERIECGFSKKDVAGAVGATAESLSRLLLRLKTEEQIVWEGAVIETSPVFWSKLQSCE